MNQDSPGNATASQEPIGGCSASREAEVRGHIPGGDHGNLRPWETILIVEDEPVVRELMSRQLARLGYRILQSPNSARAVALAAENSVDLLLTDLGIADGTTGCELAERLVALNPKLKVIYCSGYCREVVEQEHKLPHNAVFLEKPFPPHKLGQIIRATLDSAEVPL